MFPASSICNGIKNGACYLGHIKIEVFNHRLSNNESGSVEFVTIPCVGPMTEFDAKSLHPQKAYHHKQGGLDVQLLLRYNISFHRFSETFLVDSAGKVFNFSGCAQNRCINRRNTSISKKLYISPSLRVPTE